MNSSYASINVCPGQVYSLNLDFLPGKSRKLLYKPIKQFLQGHTYDVVHVHSGSISVLAYVSKAARKTGVDKVIVHSHASGVSSIKHKIIRFVFGFMLRENATDFLACSKEAGVMKYPPDVVTKKLAVINNGIDIDKYRCDVQKRALIRNKLGIAEDDYVLGHVGRISKEKNHELLIDVFLKVHEKISNSKLLLVGDGELRSKIQSKVKDCGLGDVVIFVGNVDNVQDYYQAMDVFILPSIYEGLSFVTLEAQTSGLPCVVSTGVPETVCVTENVFRIELENKQSWVDKVVALRGMQRLDNTGEIRQAGYDIKDTAAQLRNLYFKDDSDKLMIDMPEHSSDRDGQPGMKLSSSAQLQQELQHPSGRANRSDGEHAGKQEENKLRVLEITGEPILHGGQEKFIQNLIENIDHTNLTIDVLTPYYCENDAFVQTVQNGGYLP